MRCTRPVLERCKTGPVEVIQRPCGKCPACLANKAQDWVYRLYAEEKLHARSCFVTLTYDEEHVKKLVQSPTGLYSLSRKEAQDFMKRIRKAVYPVKVRFYLAGEYGENTKRAHFHVLLFGIGPESREIIEKAWNRGFVQVGNVSPSSIAYVARYCVKKLYKDSEEYKALGLEPEFCLMSRNPGIGFNALRKGLRRTEDGQYFVWYQGQRHRAPRYFVDKVRTGFERYVARCLSVSTADERSRDYENSGRSELEESKQAERNALAARKSRNKV